jgi:hypothetical protein
LVLEPPERARGLEHDHLSHHVRRDIGIRIDKRVANARLRGKMHDVRDAGVLAHQRLDGRPVRYVCGHEAEAFAGLQLREAVLLELDVVIGVQVVEADHGTAARQQRLGHMVADEAGGPGQKNLHQTSPLHIAGALGSSLPDGWGKHPPWEAARQSAPH